ncbi:GNAT family N-acetyltransferase [Micromonospora sp. CPCC 206061]|uniref:GNAT family N-acetyltransferase n=1 Tax=Micromonospora sp. CPCC 206061 TaxID=3122410 RepID=UPI002FEF8796
MQVRRISAEERLSHSFPLQAYAFEGSPAPAATADRWRDRLPYNEGNRTLVAEDGDTVLAAVTAIPMRQNVRGQLLPMAGIAGVVTHPLARRQGHVRKLLTALLGEMRDEGHPVSALYPFRPSFYARFGYAALPKRRTATFSPGDLGDLVRADLPGDVVWERMGAGYGAYREFTLRLARERHGFAVFPDFRDARLRDDDERWLVTARVDDQVVGAAAYKVTGYDGELLVDDLLVTTPLSRMLLLRFLARHVDQVSRVVAGIPAYELPELWGTDFQVTVEARTVIPSGNAPMARVLSMEALAGIQTGPGRLTVEVVDDPFLKGSFTLDGRGGTLEVSSAGGAAGATLSAAGLSALVYGVLDPEELPLRGLGAVPADAAGELRALFPRLVPHVVADF